ncbi:MAG: hypothetical protein H7061_13850 [Bdellovibrionaceae bacterium]|nr:hypothetical protein [Bdellovibrio sp.]
MKAIIRGSFAVTALLSYSLTCYADFPNQLFFPNSTPGEAIQIQPTNGQPIIQVGPPAQGLPYTPGQGAQPLFPPPPGQQQQTGQPGNIQAFPGLGPQPGQPFQPGQPNQPTVDAATANRIASAAQDSFQTKMPAFNMKPEYDCPLFSKTPYADMLSALDDMQKNFNETFRSCEKQNVAKITLETAQKLRETIAEAEKSQNTGQTYKLLSTTESIVKLSMLLQESIVTMSSLKTRGCYQNEAHYKSSLFAMNDTFQSFSPLLVGLVTKNPALAKNLGPALKIFAGADAISKAFSMLEQIALSSQQFDMRTVVENRPNTIRNVCQFMKLFNRLDYLRQSRQSQIQAVHSKFLNDIAEKRNRMQELKRQTLTLASSQRTGIVGASLFEQKVASTELETTPATDGAATPGIIEIKPPGKEQSLELYLAAKSLIDNEIVQLDNAKNSFMATVANGNRDRVPEITQCQVAVSLLNSPTSKQFRSVYDQFAQSTKDPTDYRLTIDAIDSLDREIRDSQRYKDNTRCAMLGEDVLKRMDHLLGSAGVTLFNFSQKIATSKGDEYAVERKRLQENQVLLQTAQSNFENWKTMMDYVPFESSEVEKRAENLHRYLFAGPDRVDSECLGRASTDKPCSFMESASALVLARYQKVINHGPIYTLLKDNEISFVKAYKEMNEAIRIILNYEDKMTVAAYKGKIPQEKKAFDLYIANRDKNAKELPHLSLKYLTKDLTEHNTLCSAVAEVRRKFVIASDHLMSTKGTCDMVKPVLGLKMVSQKLKDYCLPPDNIRHSRLNYLVFKLVGEYDSAKKQAPPSWALDLGLGHLFDAPVDVQHSPKMFFEKLEARLAGLDCN